MQEIPAASLRKHYSEDFFEFLIKHPLLKYQIDNINNS